MTVTIMFIRIRDTSFFYGRGVYLVHPSSSAARFESSSVGDATVISWKGRLIILSAERNNAVPFGTHGVMKGSEHVRKLLSLSSRVRRKGESEERGKVLELGRQQIVTLRRETARL